MIAAAIERIGASASPAGASRCRDPDGEGVPPYASRAEATSLTLHSPVSPATWALHIHPNPPKTVARFFAVADYATVELSASRRGLGAQPSSGNRQMWQS